MRTSIVALAVGAACAPALAQLNDTLAKARAAGTVVMGVRESSAPLSYQVGGSHYGGYHVELCEQVVAALLPGVKISYLVVTSQNRMPLVQNGTVDIECGSTTNNSARKQQVAFAVTTYVTEARLAVKAASGIERAEQLKGRTVVTTTGTTLVQRLRRLERQGVTMNLVYGKDHADSFLLLESGRADAFVMDGQIL
ncbi:MAG: transporter substrate-binding domain-containing protein, partial [Comamonadaceae bacterium]